MLTTRLPLQEMVEASDQSVLEKSPPKLMPSSAFLAPGREGSMDDKRGIPETGRYNPKWEITRKRSKQPLIADRSIWKTKAAVDDRPIIAPEIPKSHIKSPVFDQYTSRHDAPGSRIMANVSPAEAKAMFNAKDKGDAIPEGEYDIETYWTKVVKKLNPTYKFSEIGRDDGMGKTEASVPRLYPAVQGHINWLEKNPVMPTVATLSKTVIMDKMVGRERKKAIATVDDSRVDYRKVDQAFVSSFRTVGGAGPNSVSALEIGRMVARDKTAAAVRERQKLAGGGGVEGYRPSDAAIRVNTDHVVPFSKLLPKPPAELMSTVGRDAPDVWYDKEGSLRRTKDKRVPAPNFGKTVARQPEAPPKISTFLEYPKARKLDKHQRTWKMEHSIGHKELVKIPEWVQKQEEAMAATMAASTKKGTIRPHSVAGTSLLEGGTAWGGSPLKGGHVATPDLGAGGKSRPSPAARVLDKSYDTSKGLKYTQPRSPAARIANGGPGINSEEHRHVRHRLEEEIKDILQTKPGHAH